MQKVIILVLIILIIGLSFTIVNTSEDTISVFNEMDNNYNIYNLDISQANITTNNFSNYFSNYKIININPYINPIYEKFIPIKTYLFDMSKSSSSNISEFKEIYLKHIYDNNYINDYQRLNYNGIKINKISVYTTKKRLKRILNNKNFRVCN